MMDRRTALRMMLAAGLGATLDIEKLLWVPRQLIVVPEMPQTTYIGYLMLDKELTEIALQYSLGVDDFFQLPMATVQGIWEFTYGPPHSH